MRKDELKRYLAPEMVEYGRLLDLTGSSWGNRWDGWSGQEYKSIFENLGDGDDQSVVIIAC